MHADSVNGFAAFYFPIVGLAAIGWAFYRHDFFARGSPDSDIPKFALPFGVGWALCFAGIMALIQVH